MATSTEKIRVKAEHAPRFKDWLANRGGIAVWESLDLGNPGSVFTPAKEEDGRDYTKPHWRYGDKPERIVTDPAEVEVMIVKEVKRFHVGIKPGSGLMLVLTDGATRRVRKEVAKAGEGAWYEFDSQDAVIMVPEKVVPLTEWKQ